MKRIILLLICTATLGLASCKKDTIIDQGLPNQTIETVINAVDWKTADQGTRLTATLNFPEIDKETFRNDGLLVYFYPDNSVNEYKQLPYTFNAQAYTYTARPGSITFDIQTTGDNVLNPVKPTAPIGLRVVIVTSSLR